MDENVDSNKMEDNSSDSSDDEDIFARPKRRILNLSDSDSETTQPAPKAKLIDSDSETEAENPENKDGNDEQRDLFKSDDNDDMNEKSHTFNDSNKDRNELGSKIADLCDPESSDDENTADNEPIDDVKSFTASDDANTKDKPKQRLTAKQAMEQMQIIQSESNRMLREKRFHLPYHRPKQNTLKDIIDKKKIQFNLSSQKFNLRMNDEQLQEYAKKLEEKTNTALELYKSESDESDDDKETNTEAKVDEVASDPSLDVAMDKIDNIEVQSSEDKMEVDEMSQIEPSNEPKSPEHTETEVENMTETHISIRKKLSEIQILPSLNIKPRLIGGPGTLIDLVLNDIESPVDLFKKKFLVHASLKTCDEIEREQEQTTVAGTALMNFKRGLEQQISQKRLEVCNKKRLEDLEKQKLEDELSEHDDDELVKVDEKTEEVVEESEPESEEEVVYKPPKEFSGHNGFIEDEAELDDEEASSDESEVDEIVNTEKKQLTRIYKPFSDSSDDETDAKENHTNLSLESDDFMPLGQMYGSTKMPSFIKDDSIEPERPENKGRPDLANIISPLVKLSQNPSRLDSMTSDKLASLQKNLFDDSDDNTLPNTQDIADLCSGKFLTGQINSYSFTSQVEMSQNTEKELLGLCSGDFNINPTLPEPEKDSEPICIDEVTSKSTKTDIKSFFMPKSADESQSSNFGTTESTPTGKLIIMTSSDEDDSGERPVKKKKLKKRPRAKPLEISDDSDDEGIENGVDVSGSEASEADSDDLNQVEYDSEENEIEVPKLKASIEQSPIHKKQSEFFENEAELTSEDEWHGSGDEDEKDLDRLEREEGDDDTFDERKLNKELEKIHRHQMQDKDSREIKILQDLLLEDGDLEGGTRERKFRWKNIDDAIESGAIVGDENPDENTDEIQSEEQWRRQRYERETYLKQLKENDDNLGKNVSNMNIRLSIIKGELLPKLKDEDVKATNNITTKITNSELPKAKTKDIPSPVKTPFNWTQPKFKGSFLSRSEAALNRLSLLTKNGVLSKDLTGKKTNFVFTTVSPQQENNDIDEDAKKLKRKAAMQTTPALIKKIKTAEEKSSKKSLFDHIE